MLNILTNLLLILSKKNRSQLISRLLKISNESLWVILGQVLVMTGNFFLLSILTNNLTVANYGQISLLLSIIALSNSLLLGGINNSIFRFYSISIDDKSTSTFKRDSFELLIIALGLLCILYIPVLIYFLVVKQFNYFFLAIGLYFYSIFFTFNNSIITVFNAARKRFKTVMLSTSEVWIKILLISIFIYFGQISITGVYLSYSISIILIVIFGYYILNEHFKKIYTKQQNELSYKNDMLKFSLPYLYWGVFVSIQQVSDRFSLSLLKGPIDVGHYSVIFQLGYTPITIFFALFSSILAPIFYMKAGNIKNNDRLVEVKHFLSISLIIGLVLLFISFSIGLLFHRIIFKIAVGKTFWNYSYLMPWLILPAGFTSLAELLGLFFSTMKLQEKIVTIKIGTAIFAIFSNIIGAYFFGIIGVVFALNIFSAVYLLLMYYVYLKHKF
jgi:O-antigen/teichoic acid export membrane protein